LIGKITRLNYRVFQQYLPGADFHHPLQINRTASLIHKGLMPISGFVLFNQYWGWLVTTRPDWPGHFNQEKAFNL
jgi:hypothetical protein